MHKNEGVKTANEKLKKEKAEYQVIFGELTGTRCQLRVRFLSTYVARTQNIWMSGKRGGTFRSSSKRCMLHLSRSRPKH